MSKYVIELGEDVQIVQSINVTEHGNAYTNTQLVGHLKELNSDYINEHFSGLQDDAYQRGVEDGRNESWEAAWKIMDMDDFSAMDAGLDTAFNLPATEAIKRFKAYEEKQKAENEIKVGDEVIDEDDEKFWVTKIHNGIAEGIMANGEVTCTYLDVTERTGRHIDIEKILNKMKE